MDVWKRGGLGDIIVIRRVVGSDKVRIELIGWDDTSSEWTMSMDDFDDMVKTIKEDGFKGPSKG